MLGVVCGWVGGRGVASGLFVVVVGGGGVVFLRDTSEV